MRNFLPPCQDPVSKAEAGSSAWGETLKGAGADITGFMTIF